MRKAACADYWQRVRVLAAARWPPFCVLCVGLYALHAFKAHASLPLDDPLRSEFWVDNVYTTVSVGVPMFVALVLSEALGLRGTRHAFVTALSLALAVVAAAAFLLALGNGDLSWMVVRQQLPSHWPFTLVFFWTHFAATLLLAGYFAVREREGEAARLAEAANAQRAAAERATTAARLKVMQARVEPELLFGALNEARARYVRSFTQGDALLDDLIAYLRAALPQMRGDASTLAREVALAAAYAGVAPRSDERHADVVVSLDDHAGREPFPPMILLPLVRAAASEPCDRISIVVSGPPMRVAVRVEPQRSPSGWSDEALAPVRATLAHYFGPGASLSAASGSATVAWG